MSLQPQRKTSDREKQSATPVISECKSTTLSSTSLPLSTQPARGSQELRPQKESVNTNDSCVEETQAGTKTDDEKDSKGVSTLYSNQYLPQSLLNESFDEEPFDMSQRDTPSPDIPEDLNNRRNASDDTVSSVQIVVNDRHPILPLNGNAENALEAVS